MTHRPMTLKSVKPEKRVLMGHDIGAPATRAKALKDHVGTPLNECVGTPLNECVGTSLNECVGVQLSKASAMSSRESIGIPVYIMNKSDIEKELSKIEERFGMSPDKFYEAWKNDEFHGFQAMKFGCLYEFYRDEFE